MADSNEILQQLIDDVRDVRSVFIASNDGFLIDGVTTNNNIDLEDLAASVIPKIDEMADLSEDFAFGPWEISMVEFENGTLLVSWLEDDAILVVSARGRRNIGTLRMKIKKLADDLRQTL